MSIIEGVYVMGTCVGYSETPWKNDDSRMNRTIGISRTFTDKWDQTVTDIVEVEVPADGAEKFKKQAAMLKGKAVMLRVIPMAKAGGRNGAFLKLFAPKESDLLPQAPQAPVAAPAPVRQAS